MLKTTRKIIFIGIIIALSCSVLIISLTFYKKVNDYNSMLTSFSKITGNEIIFGDENAAHSIIVYFDYNCDFCKKFFRESYPSLNEQYIKPGRVKLVLKLVCNNTDIFALKAYLTAICVNKFGNYKKLHQLLMHKSEIIYTEHFSELIDELIYANDAIAGCILNNEYNPVKESNLQLQKLKTYGTPTFIINNSVVAGYIDFSSLQKVLKKEYSLN